MKITLLVFTLAIGVSASPEGQREQFTAKFQRTPSGHITVPVKVNGKGPFRLLFDTGATVCMIGTRAAREAGIDVNAPQHRLPMGSGGLARPFRTETFEVGNAVVRDLPVGISDYLQPLDGIVGFTFYARFRTTINYQKGEITFEPLDLAQSDPTGRLQDRLAGGLRPTRKSPPPAVVFGVALEDLGDETREARVVSVFPGSPADKAGLKRGDRIVSVDEWWVETPPDLYGIAAALSPDRPVRLKVVRDGKEMELLLTPRAGQ